MIIIPLISRPNSKQSRQISFPAGDFFRHLDNSLQSYLVHKTSGNHVCLHPLRIQMALVSICHSLSLLKSISLVI